MKRIVSLLVALSMIIAFTAALSSCEMLNQFLPETEDVITVEDGYLVVNGVKTEYKVEVEDVVTVEDGYLVVNGAKTEYKVEVEDEDNNQNNEDEDDNQNNDGEVRTTVTEDEFMANFAIENYTLKYTYEVLPDGENPGFCYIYDLERTETASFVQVEGRMGEYSQKMAPDSYWVLKEDVWYYVKESEGAYVGEVTDSNFDNLGGRGAFPMHESVAPTLYSYSVYDEEEKAYTFSQTSEYGTSICASYFEDGKIVKLVVESIPNEGTHTIETYEISNIGTTVVEVPEFTIVDNSDSNQ